LKDKKIKLNIDTTQYLNSLGTGGNNASTD